MKTNTLFGAVEVQRDFSAVTKEVATQYQCPECGYEWSGKTRSDAGKIAPAEKASLFTRKKKKAAARPPTYQCPKCHHEWDGKPRPSVGGFGKSAAPRVVLARGSEKPPYRVPSMRDVAKLPWNGFKVVSTFSGCGGSSLGYKMAGFKVLWASEFVPAARATYQANFPKTIVDARDIRKVKPEDILRATGLKKGELDLLDGSPPCASFSTAGKREKHWGEVKNYSDVKQRTDDLFFEYVRLLKGLQPKCFVAENVSGLVKGSAKGYFKMILKALEDCGYRVAVKVLDAQWLGVPQQRQRAIFVGVRRDLGIEPAHPLPLSYRYTVRDALPWITRVGKEEGAGREFDAKLEADRPAPSVLANKEGGSYSGYFVEGERIERVRKCDNKGRPIWKKADETAAPAIMGAIPRDATIQKDMGRDGLNGVVEVTKKRVPVRVVHNTNGPTCPDRPGRLSRGNVTDRPCPAIVCGSKGSASSHYLVEEIVVEDASRLRGAVGAEWDKLKPGEQSDKYFNLVRPDPDAPSPAVTAIGGTGAASVTHPVERRKFTIEELKRICSFPDDFEFGSDDGKPFKSSYAQRWERMGRAVPPLMMRAIAETVRDQILRKIPSKVAKR